MMNDFDTKLDSDGLRITAERLQRFHLDRKVEDIHAELLAARTELLRKEAA